MQISCRESVDFVLKVLFLREGNLSGLTQLYMMRGGMIVVRSKAMAMTSAGKNSGSNWRMLRMMG
jgi:hypothetical protein